MRVLLLLSESWNDIQFPNNNMTNWFQGFENIEIWTISGSAQLPNNACCKEYFLIGEMEMLKSIVGKSRAGKRVTFEVPPQSKSTDACEFTKQKQIKKLVGGEMAYLARDIVWRVGRYDLDSLQKFINDCKPDLVFSQRRGSIKMCRLEQAVMRMTAAPMIAYTGDDEYSLHQYSLSPIFWFRRLWCRRWLKNTVSSYRLLFSQSERQMKEYEKEMGIKTKFLVKCGEFDKKKIHLTVGEPIRIVYAGKLYCNRWRTLQMLADALARINQEKQKIVFRLDIYTADAVSHEMKAALNDGYSSIIHGAVPAEEVLHIYENSDIVLHVESFDRHNRLITQDSFSTKVVDCLASGAAVMAICWENHAALRYLRHEKAAITATTEREIYNNLSGIADDNSIVLQYAQRAYDCGMRNHQRKSIQESLMQDFLKVINQ